MEKPTNGENKFFSALINAISCGFILGIGTAIAGDPLPGIVIGFIAGFVIRYMLN